MIFYQKWQGCAVIDSHKTEYFPVAVPGNIQKDYAEKNGWGDINYMNNCLRYIEIEDYGWSYVTTLDFDAKKGERVFFVTKGIEYQYDIILDGEKLLYHEGMFTPVELDITDKAHKGSVLEVYIYPHPKREGAAPCRDQADQSCKPAVEYGWDWHPRVLVSGIFDETFIEVRNDNYIGDVEVFYTLDSTLTKADLHFDIDCDKDVQITLFDMDGKVVYTGTQADFSLSDINLWWCNGYGEPYLYTWKVTCGDCEKSGTVGFKKIKLIMAENAWFKTMPFPKGRNDAPITIELNGKVVFAKGSNWVNPEVFSATITEETYFEQVRLAKEANMNILRCWGGAIIDKEAFFDACDKYGIMVWQEFPLACNNYIGTPSYLAVLEPEARAIVKRVRRHVSHVLWCGGNELFNGWSKMTDQSHALRLLNKVCYEEDFAKPFLATSPIIGMSHGGYFFVDETDGKTVFEIYRNSHSTAYTEFGCPSMASLEQLNSIFDSETLSNPSSSDDSPWVIHHAFKAWRINSWAHLNVIDSFFGKQQDIASYVEKSQFLQCEGYKCIFEEARRQKPYCSMAINWDYNEPWKTAAGNNLLEYPSKKKSAYYAVREALRPVMPSMRFEHFSYKPGEVIYGELWLLNDTFDSVSDVIDVYFTVDGVKKHLLTWNTDASDPGKNICGHKVAFPVPNSPTQVVTVTLEAKCGKSTYNLLLKNDSMNGDVFIPQLNF